MSIRKLIALTVLLGLLLPAVAAAAPAPLLLGPCIAGAIYDPACDVDHDGDVDTFDVQKTAGHWNQSGVWVSDNNHNHLGQSWVSSGNPLFIEGTVGAPYYAPLILNNTHGSGMRVGSAAHHGLQVDAAGQDGIFVCRTGSAGSCTSIATNNGVEIGSAQHYGVYVYSAGASGLFVGSAGSDGVMVGSTGFDGVYVGSAGDDGVDVDSAGDNGVYVRSAGSSGLHVVHAGGDGVFVCRTGVAGDCTPNGGNNGVEIGAAQNNGLYVGYASNNGLYVASAINGVYVNSASNWAGYFTGNINVTGNCTGCLIAQMAVNTGEETLQPGDVLAVEGIAASPFDDLDMLLRVRRATPGSPLVGVVSGRAESFTSSEDGTHTIIPRADEPAAPGEYLSVVIYGPVQVKAANEVRLGDRVTVADDLNGVRALSTFQVQRTDGGLADVIEAAPVLGVALDAAHDGMVWVLVNPQ